MTALEVEARASTPLPPGRGRWRITIHNRTFAPSASPQQTGIGELVDARSRRLEQKWNSAAQLTFTVDGHSQAAALIQELTTDVVAWRYDEARGIDRMMFRGIVTQSEDQLTEQQHTVNYTAHDYLALLARRYVTSPTGVSYPATDQDTIAAGLLGLADHPRTSANADVLYPGSRLPLVAQRVNPDGTARGALSGVVRDRNYLGQQEIGAALDDLAHVINGFDYDVFAASDGASGFSSGVDLLRIFYPVQGVTRTDMALVYGSTVSALTRSVNSTDYANYSRVLGNNNSTVPTDPQLYGEAYNSDANNVSVNPVGLWMLAENAADVSIQSTLDQQARGNVFDQTGAAPGGRYGILVPSYTVQMRSGAYQFGRPNMGDTVPLVVQSGRLNVNTTVRVVGINYAIGDDGQEDIELVVGRPAVTLARLITGAGRDINALARR